MAPRPPRYLPRRPRLARARTRVGVAWYTPAAWVRLKNAVPDPERLEDSHAKWLELVTSVCADMARAGVETVRIEVDPDEFLAWCRDQARSADSGARAQFVAERLRRRDLARKRAGD